MTGSSLDVELPLVEVFRSLQGEGYNTGMPVTFVRLGQCNLGCAWCDTDYQNYQMWPISTIVRHVLSLDTPRVIITGGEPLLHPELDLLLAALKTHDKWLGLETNGLVVPPASLLARFDYIAISPKAFCAERYRDDCFLKQADEVRVVVDGDVQAFCETIRTLIQAPRYYLAPCERMGQMNVRETVELLGRLNQNLSQHKWRLSLQTHKLGNFT